MSQHSQALPTHQQAQYLDAMGITLWVPRYRLPNAQASSECEWPESQAAPDTASTQGLHQLLKDAETAQTSAVPTTPHQPEAAEVPPQQGGGAQHSAQIRSLLTPDAQKADQAPTPDHEVAPSADAAQPPPSEQATPAAASAEPQAPLRFAFNALMLGQRWLILTTDGAFTAPVLAFLDAVLSALGEPHRTATRPVDFHWPMIDGFSSEAPLEEAREGMRAFAEGRKHQGGAPECVWLFADPQDEHAQVLSEVLNIAEGRSQLLSLPMVRAASLDDVMTSADAKRQLWRQLLPIQQQLLDTPAAR
ncbi:hypothetical protein [Carnimonas bestiolae]|uniref:hypothetical protein n=1 Tax=Carnimonas bestiolae TaxID=3402172 RepID=UPI003EDBA2B8